MELINELKPLGCDTLKGVGWPEYYLGGNILLTRGQGRQKKTKLSAKTYTLEKKCDKVEHIFNTTLRNYHSQLEGSYHPELDMTDILDEEDVSKYRILIGSMIWAVTLGRIDVIFAVNALERYSCAPRHGHLKQHWESFVT